MSGRQVVVETVVSRVTVFCYMNAGCRRLNHAGPTVVPIWSVPLTKRGRVSVKPMNNTNPEKTEDHGRTIARGAVINGLGLAGKALIPLFFIVGAKIYGTAAMGLFYLSYTMIIVTESLV
jgi:hypothetical protein